MCHSYFLRRGLHSKSLLPPEAPAQLQCPIMVCSSLVQKVHPLFVDTANAKIPLTALTGQVVKYTVTYTSHSNTPSTLAEVFIDGIPHTMVSTGGIASHWLG